MQRTTNAAHGGHPTPQPPFTPPDLRAPIPPASPQGAPSFARVVGLHPLVAGIMFAADHALFVVLEAPSFGFLCFVSAAVGFALVLPCALIQRFLSNDSWPAAFTKALAVGVLTAIPTSLASF